MTKNTDFDWMLWELVRQVPLDPLNVAHGSCVKICQICSRWAWRLRIPHTTSLERIPVTRSWGDDERFDVVVSESWVRGEERGRLIVQCQRLNPLTIISSFSFQVEEQSYHT